MKKIAVLTSGGDAQGMNAAIYGIFGKAQELGYELYGIRNGYAGLLREDIRKLHREDVRHIVAKGGTILGTARCDEFKELSVQKKAADICRKYGISDLIVIGGDGSYQGAYCLSKQGIGVVGVPGPSIWILAVRNTRLVLTPQSILRWKPLTVSQIPQKHIPASAW